LPVQSYAFLSHAGKHQPRHVTVAMAVGVLPVMRTKAAARHADLLTAVHKVAPGRM